LRIINNVHHFLRLLHRLLYILPNQSSMTDSQLRLLHWFCVCLTYPCNTNSCLTCSVFLVVLNLKFIKVEHVRVVIVNHWPCYFLGNLLWTVIKFNLLRIEIAKRILFQGVLTDVAWIIVFIVYILLQRFHYLLIYPFILHITLILLINELILLYFQQLFFLFLHFSLILFLLLHLALHLGFIIKSRLVINRIERWRCRPKLLMEYLIKVLIH